MPSATRIVRQRQICRCAVGHARFGLTRFQVRGDLSLSERGHEVAPRGETTLVAWRAEDAEAEAARLREAGIVIRFLPGRALLRASVGAWNDESDLERLLEAL